MSETDLSKHQEWIINKMKNEDAFIFTTETWKFGRKADFECAIIWDNGNKERTLLPRTVEILIEKELIKKYDMLGKFNGKYVLSSEPPTNPLRL